MSKQKTVSNMYRAILELDYGFVEDDKGKIFYWDGDEDEDDPEKIVLLERDHYADVSALEEGKVFVHLRHPRKLKRLSPKEECERRLTGGRFLFGLKDPVMYDAEGLELAEKEFRTQYSPENCAKAKAEWEQSVKEEVKRREEKESNEFNWSNEVIATANRKYGITLKSNESDVKAVVEKMKAEWPNLFVASEWGMETNDECSEQDAVRVLLNAISEHDEYLEEIGE